MHPPRPTHEQLEAIAAGATMSSQVLEYIRHWDQDGTIQAELESLQKDQEFLAEFIEANRDQVKGPAPITEQQAPDGYEIIRELDRGGQGVVYLARQIRTKREVALKMILQTAFTTERQKQRFEREVELVASIKHPNIVTVFDSGVTPDGRLFTAMEYIKGVPLNLFRIADGSETGREPDLVERIHAFLKVCNAVTSAHLRAIIHRDLKPLNILVDEECEPHVLDFGLAKVVGPEAMTDSAMAATAAGEFMGTFAYASPEQVSGDPELIDTRTDVYALGVILYELLLEARPYELGGSINDMIKGIMDVQPIKPSSIDPGFDRDLETILLMALAKDTDRRFQSVRDLADDLQHWLDGEPILARRDDAWYVLRKYITRHRLPVSLVAGFILLLIAFAITMSVLFTKVALANKRLAGTLGMASQVIASADPENNQKALTATTAVDMLEAWSTVVNEDLADEPGISVRIYNDLGESFIGFDRYEQAQEHLEQALEALADLDEGPSLERARALHNLGRIAYKRAKWDDAYAAYDQALEMRRLTPEARHLDVAETLQHRGATLRRLGNLPAAEDDMNEALHILEGALERSNLASEDHRIRGQISSTLNGLGLLHSKGNPQLSIEYYKKAIRLHRTDEDEVPDADWRIGRLLHNIALCQIRLGDFDGARASLESSLYIKEAGLRRLEEEATSNNDMDAGNQLQLANSRYALAAVQHELDLKEDAWENAQQSLQIRLLVLDEQHPKVLDSRLQVSELLLANGKASESLEELQLVHTLRQARGDSARQLAEIDLLRGHAMLELGRHEDAETILAMAWTELDALKHGRAHEAALLLARSCDERGDAESAHAWRDRAKAGNEEPISGGDGGT
ncbi:MAG: serine/threonine-protein kinase [Phycisphaerales bacterium]|nr:serine/threonine-protein kinase [Phycisphaerales bacterium]